MAEASTTDKVCCDVYPAVPDDAVARRRQPCRVRRDNGEIVLSNGFLAAHVGASDGVVRAVVNKLTGQTHVLVGDVVGFAAAAAGRKIEWSAGRGESAVLTVEIEESPAAVSARFSTEVGGLGVAIVYRLERRRFWLERHLEVRPPAPGEEVTYDRLLYGKLDSPGSARRVLELGRFDRPALAGFEGGGLFAGVGWWFYSLDAAGVYRNDEMNFATPEPFAGEPWHLGVFRREAGEPWDGWLWYRHFLQLRKDTHDKHTHYSHWNLGWGHWSLELDDDADACLDLAGRIGIRGVLFGGGMAGKGVREYIRLAKDSPAARKNIAEVKARGMDAGVLEAGRLKEQWADDAVLAEKLALLDAFVSAGLAAYHFDYFAITDTYKAHRNVTRYFRAARERLNYTECHLGMAAYGPQFQREVLINHPTDLHGFDLSRFSSDWATFCGFRQSRRQWQQRYDYLMPECGLYYFVTHYANVGRRRQYTDPEPQQFLYSVQAYCGISYDFHDALGFRSSLVAASAFSPYPVFGHLEPRMPQEDVAFAREYLNWVAENAGLLRLARVCFEDDNACVVSKIRGGSGAVFLLNYGPARRTFRLSLAAGCKEAPRCRQVYPTRGDLPTPAPGGTIDVAVPGEAVAILDINDGLATHPPEDRSQPPIDVTGWRRAGEGFSAAVSVPDLRDAIAIGSDPSLPTMMSSVEQDSEALAESWIGGGRIPDVFLNAYGFVEARTVETWKFAPWAFAGRVWLVHTPTCPARLTDEPPRLKVNGRAAKLYPRVDYRPDETKDWLCPVFFADVTDLLDYGGSNEVVLSGPGEGAPGGCRLVIAGANVSG